MITCSSLGINGRLGNQMFQYAALRSLGIYRGYDISLGNIDDKECHGQKCLLKNFNIKQSFDTVDNIKYIYQEPDHMTFDQRFFNIPDNTDIVGYFQSIAYFEHCESTIKEELFPIQSISEVGKNYISNIKNRFPEYKIISIHLRRGDNIGKDTTSKMLEKIYEDGTYTSYVNSAINIFKQDKVKFLIFSGGNRNNNNNDDILWCKNFFKNNDVIFSEDSDSITDFSRILHCDGHILSHASSFGWWAAYINNKDKKIVAPNNYHPNLPNYTHRYKFYPKEYILL